MRTSEQMAGDLVGRKVAIYQDPITRVNFEDDGVVEEVLGGDQLPEGYLARCRVRFDDGVFERTYLMTVKGL